MNSSNKKILDDIFKTSSSGLRFFKLFKFLEFLELFFSPYAKHPLNQEGGEKPTLGKDFLALTKGIENRFRKKFRKGWEYTFGGLERADHLDKKTNAGDLEFYDYSRIVFAT